MGTVKLDRNGTLLLMASALYLNGVFKTVLDEILAVQKGTPEKVCYLQPYSESQITLLAKAQPTPTAPVTVYISRTDSLDFVSYRGRIVGWQDKRRLSDAERQRLNEEHFNHYQHGEKEVYLSMKEGQLCVNLISITHLEQLEQPIPVETFIKSSDGTPLRARTQSGRWSYVEEVPESLGRIQSVIAEEAQATFQEEVKKSGVAE